MVRQEPRGEGPGVVASPRLGEFPKMKKDLMDILACPACKGELRLTAEQEEGDEVVSGSLYVSALPPHVPDHRLNSGFSASGAAAIDG